jgi:1-pyrroline-5-carboxylate dehydrogenase
MSNTLYSIPAPKNEPIVAYGPGSVERKRQKEELNRQSGQTLDIPLMIGGKAIRTGKVAQVTMPHQRDHVLATFHQAGPKEIARAIDAALEAKRDWENLPWTDRAALGLKAAQSKNVFQAEIDSTCELADFLRFNAYYLSRIYRNQPANTPDTINRMDYRPLEGYVLAVTPFNFTAIAGNLCTAPALMGNTVVWKPASAAVLSGYYLMQLFKEAGFPDGVINFIPCSGATMGDALLKNPNLAGIHFTGSTAVFQSMWRSVGKSIDTYRSYPRIVGETGGKNFVVAHPSADLDALCTGLIRGAFEYQGQKCSAASRAYIPESLWDDLRKKVAAALEEITMGDPREFDHLINALIDQTSFDRVMGYIQRARASDKAEIVFGGTGDNTQGYFIQPTVIQVKDPKFVTMVEEIFGPVLSVYVYPDDAYAQILDLCDETSPYALTGAVFARDRHALARAEQRLRHTAGNFYLNDKPTGSVVGQQPFGGARASGTNDKAGSMLNLLRWTSARCIKENLAPPTDYRYPFMD